MNPWSSGREEPIHSSTAERNENQTPVQEQRCQSRPSAKSSVTPSVGDSFKIFGADQRLQISDLHFDKFPTPATFACWKIRFKTEVCTCSQFPTEAMHWIKEVEMVDSADDYKSSSSIRGISMPNFEVLDARIASALNRIIYNSHFKRKVNLEEQKAQKEDSFLRGRQIAYLIYEYFRVTGANDSVENYADLFTIAFRNDDVLEFDSKCDGILLSMTKIPSDEILESLCKFRIRDIEQNLRMKNFEARNGNYETSAVVKNPWVKQREQRTLGDCWQWKANGQCSKGDNCSFWHDMNKCAKSTQPNPSPRSSTRQSVNNASRTRSP